MEELEGFSSKHHLNLHKNRNSFLLNRSWELIFFFNLIAVFRSFCSRIPLIPKWKWNDPSPNLADSSNISGLMIRLDLANEMDRLVLTSRIMRKSGRKISRLISCRWSESRLVFVTETNGQNFVTPKALNDEKHIKQIRKKLNFHMAIWKRKCS